LYICICMFIFLRRCLNSLMYLYVSLNLVVWRLVDVIKFVTIYLLMLLAVNYGDKFGWIVWKALLGLFGRETKRVGSLEIIRCFEFNFWLFIGLQLELMMIWLSFFCRKLRAKTWQSLLLMGGRSWPQCLLLVAVAATGATEAGPDAAAEPNMEEKAENE
jgi:hypothetical protein